MTSLPTLKSRQVIRVLIRIGFIEHRHKGSHKIFKRDNQRVVVPIHNRDLKKGTVKNIIDQTGLTVDEFLNLLK